MYRQIVVFGFGTGADVCQGIRQKSIEHRGFPPGQVCPIPLAKTYLTRPPGLECDVAHGSA